MVGSAEPTADDDRAARRTIVLAVVALAALLAGVLVVAVTQLARGGGDDADGLVTAAGEGGGEAVTSIGPAPRVDVATYIAGRRAALDAAEGTRVAVVSLASYRNEAAARAVVAGKSVTVEGLLVAARGGAPAVVLGSLDDWAESEAEAALEERSNIEQLVPTVEDPEFAAFYRAELDRLARVAEDARARGDVVFGLVVQGDAGALRGLAAVADIRLVDVGIGGALADGAVLTGLRPEEQVLTEEPDLRPV